MKKRLISLLLLTLMTPSMLLSSCNKTDNGDEFSPEKLEASVVWKNGASGVVTFVLDDGDHTTAGFVRDEMQNKYSELRVSYALITSKIATIQTTDDETAYRMTDDGKYVYTLKDSEVEYWRSHIDAGYCEFLSHSWTHAKWGQNDNGGEQTLTDYSGNPTGTKVFPKGHITMELAASQQLLRDVFGQSGQYFVKPGTGMKEFPFYTSLLTGGSIYEGARSTAKALNDPSKLKGSYLDINAWMVAATDSPYAWNDFIDQAVKDGQWATFCIHNIAPDGTSPSGHYIFQENADITFAYANALALRGKLWIATMTEAANYIRLRNATTVSAELKTQDSVTVKLRTSLSGEYFDDIALTVRVEIPDSWSGKVNVSNGSTAQIQSDSNGNYVYLELIPTKDTVSFTLTQA